MNCFNHPGTPAIGTCKACSKGLYKDCASDIGHGLACKDVHEAEVNDQHMIFAKNVKIYAAAPKNTLIAPFFAIFMGIVFAIY